MSYTTTADEKLSEAKSSIRDAILALTDVVVNGCDGAYDFKPEYQESIADALTELISVRKKLQ